LPDHEREERYRILYESVRAPVLAYALRRTSSPDDAADVVAETLTIAWRRLDHVPAGEAGLLWCYATARRVLANQGRAARRRTELVDRIGHELASAYRRPDEGTERVAAREALELLGEADRELLMLASWEGLDSSQLAQVLGCSRTAARIRLHRARARLAGMTGDGKQPPPTGQSPPREAAPKRAPEGA
jgi:RNA polymerase sigma factor (sigma-70 family)